MDVKVSVERDYWWVPEWNGNQSEATPVRFHKRMLTGAERIKFLTATGGTLQLDNEGIFSATVTGIENLSVNGKAITTGREMLRYGELYLLALESVGESLQRGAGDLGNSSSPSHG